MYTQDAMDRITFTADRRYFIRASALWSKPTVGSARIVVKAEVFTAPPQRFTGESIFLHVADATTSDLLDALQSGEAAARRYIDSLPRKIA